MDDRHGRFPSISNRVRRRRRFHPGRQLGRPGPADAALGLMGAVLAA